MTDAECLKWGYNILSSEGLEGWKIELKSRYYSEGLTIFKTKTILLYWPQDKPWPALVLHEIAHAKISKPGHDSIFAHEYMNLVSRWLSVNRKARYTNYAETLENV